MLYCNNPDSDEPIMLINKHIGNDADDGIGIDGAIFQQELLTLDEMGKKRIQIWINSPGGIVMDGYNIYATILKTKTKVDTYNMGIAASIAAVIFQAGRKRYALDYSKLMYHNPYGADAKSLDPMKDSIAIMIAERTGHTKDEILDIMKRTTWMNADGEDGALALNFCDEIEKSSDHNKPRMSSSDAKMMWSDANKILNSIFKPNTIIDMKKVTNKLKLTDAANEDAIVDAIDAITNKATLDAKNAADKIAEMQDAFEKKEKEAKDALDALNAMKDEKEKSDKAAKDALDAKDAAECKNMLEGYAKQGRIKTESIADWTKIANKIGNDEVKKQLEALPLNKAANKIKVTDVANSDEKRLTGVVASAMAEIRAKNKL